MMLRHSLPILLLAWTAAPTLPAWAARSSDEACAGFSWDVSRERALFGTAARAETAGASARGAPLVTPDQLYDLTLAPQGKVHFVVAPERHWGTQDSFAGLIRLRVRTAGVYRITLGQPAWLDVVSGREIIHPRDFQGAAGCTAPNKIVEFELPAGRELTLQLSGLNSRHARVAITERPDS